MSDTDKNTAICLLNEYLKKTYGQDVLEYIGYKGDVGKARLTALIQNSLPKKEILSDNDIDIARIRIERHMNEKSGIPLTSPTGKKSETYPWQKGHGVCNIEPESRIEKKQIIITVDKTEKPPGISPLPSRSSYTIKPKEKKKLPGWLIEKLQEEKEKGHKPVKYSGYAQDIGDIKCRSCGSRMSTGQIVCVKCGKMRQ